MSQLINEMDVNSKKISLIRTNNSYDHLMVSKPNIPNTLEVDQGYKPSHTVTYTHTDNIGYRIGNNPVSRGYSVTKNQSTIPAYS